MAPFTRCYWLNPDLTNIQVFGKDIRALLAISCQKIFFEEGHTYYHYGPFELQNFRGSTLDLAVATNVGTVDPGVSAERRSQKNELVLTDRVYEFHYLKQIVVGMLERAGGARFKTDNVVLNLSLLSLMLDFGLFEEHVGLLNVPGLQSLKRGRDTRQLQVEVSNMIFEFDQKNSNDSVTRLQVEELLFEVSHKFIVNKDFDVYSRQFELIQLLNGDPAYQQYVLLCKVYMSLCQINKSVEVDYYKVRCNGEYRILIPQKFSKATSDYLDATTKRYTFTEHDGCITYDELPLFDVRPQQPDIALYRVRFDSATAVSSMVKYIEISNAFRSILSDKQYLIFIAGSTLRVDIGEQGGMQISLNKIAIELATIFFNEAISFVPCFKYAESEDVILFASRNIHYLVDQGGQFCSDYYGMKHELIDSITSEEVFVDLNDDHIFKKFKLSELLTESKTVIYFPDYLLQVPNRQQLINLLDMAIYVRNVSFFMLVLFYLERSSVKLDYIAKDEVGTKITGPWRAAIEYVLGIRGNADYDAIFERQFFDLNQHEQLPLADFIDTLCDNFTRYQRHTDGAYQIVPTQKQKDFLRRIICAEECFHFSEVGSGKTKVILPLLCQTFLSNNAEAHANLARGGSPKNVLIILVPEHLVPDARTQVYRYCLNLNFREKYRVYDDIFALLHNSVQLGTPQQAKRYSSGGSKQTPPVKQIFITSFNQFKKALTNDKICDKVWPNREHILVVADEVDDFLDRDKLVFNICSNKNNAFDRPTIQRYFAVSSAAYSGAGRPDASVSSSANPVYWTQLFDKFGAIHAEIQHASRSINKSFGIFNEQTLRHCSTNIAHDCEGYKSLIARPYESVNRAMPGSYYSDVERTIYLTYVILVEDTAKYDELFQQERKFISFEFWSEHIRQLDFDDLVYGHDRLSELVVKQPGTKAGLTRFLYEIILRRMEIRDKSRSVNSIDVVFNFDCTGFTGTPFIDNYPTFSYIRNGREDQIPDLIDRSSYAYASEALSTEAFEERFERFQGTNNNVLVEYVASDFVTAADTEIEVLRHIFAREAQTATPGLGDQPLCFNALVDLCGIFKRSSIHEVRDLVLKQFGPDQFHFVYHIDQVDGSDRVLSISSDNDVQFDEEFYNHLCNTYGAGLRDRIFFFVDNRNVIGKDIPFQLVYQRRFSQPMFIKSVVLAHDVDDFSKIWQAMGRSRTMNATKFAIYKSDIPPEDVVAADEASAAATQRGWSVEPLLGVSEPPPAAARGGSQLRDIKKLGLTRKLYIQNCDCKMAGNLSSIYQTLISLLNLSRKQFYYRDTIVNTFLEKMDMTISGKVRAHEEDLAYHIFGNAMPAKLLAHTLGDKFQKSAVAAVAAETLTPTVVNGLLKNIVQQKFEQREPTGDIYDAFILFLSGEQQSLMEISYTKQQQKQKQKQKNKNQNSDTMDSFSKKHQLPLEIKCDNYFAYTLDPSKDRTKILLNLPLAVPIFTLAYAVDGAERVVRVYPTIQFLYSHHIDPSYITKEVKELVELDPATICARFEAEADRPAAAAEDAAAASAGTTAAAASPERLDQLGIKVIKNKVGQNAKYTLAAIKEGVYIIGMKDQFNIHDLKSQPLHRRVQHIVDDVGFVLFDRNQEGPVSVDAFGPYFIEQYVLMEMLSKQEVAQNVLDYFVNHKHKLEQGLQSYSGAQGKGFICWRFVVSESSRAAAAPTDHAAGQ